MRKLKRALSRNKEGMSLIGTLLVGSLMLTLGFTAAAMTFSHFTLTNVADRQSVCRSLAEAAANRAVARCLADITYGTKGNIGDDITVKFSSAPDGWGKVYFGGSDPVAFGNIPRSNNFLAQDLPNQSTGRVVPSRSLHVIAIGQWGKTRRAVETIVSIPKFKYAIASTGQVSSTGGLLVAGVKNPGAVEKGVSQIPDDQWAPGCMMSNSNDATKALDLDSGGAPSKVTGDVQAVGGIKLGANTVVEGSVKSFNSPEEVPKVTATDYDTASMAGCNTTIGANEMGLNVVGPARRAGSLTVTGGLNMDAGILYVDGDVTVFGGLHGKGALISTGKVTINNQSKFHAADDQAAIVAQSDVKISGSDKDDCVYNGVVFTQGNFAANDVTLLGSLCAGKASGSTVELNQVNMLSNPISMDLQYSIEGPLAQHVMDWRKYYGVPSPGVPDPIYGYTAKVQGPGSLYQNPVSVDPTALPRLMDPSVPSDSNVNQVSFTAGAAYEQKVGGPQTFEFRGPDPTSVQYNTDVSPGYDSSLNGGAGGFSYSKWVKTYPLGQLDGNSKLRLDNLHYKDSNGVVGEKWALEQAFNGRTLYEAIRSNQGPNPQKFKMVNRDDPSRSVYVTFAEVFNPDGDATSNYKWAQTAGNSWWTTMAGTGGTSHMTNFVNPYGSWLPDPLPDAPWNQVTQFLDPTDITNWCTVMLAEANWLNSQSSLFLPKYYNGSFNFNPLQFVQLRDQSQRLLWREYDPG